ncbi:unnamed protein product, partial [Closterium sp. Naga37s-1]
METGGVLNEVHHLSPSLPPTPLLSTPLYSSLLLSTPLYTSLHLSTPLYTSLHLSNPLYSSLLLSYPPPISFWTVETGGVLNEVHHFYCYPGGWEERDAVRAGMAGSRGWTHEYLPLVKPAFQSQESSIFLEDSKCMAAVAEAAASSSTSSSASPTSVSPSPPAPLEPSPASPGVYELRCYKARGEPESPSTTHSIQETFSLTLSARMAAVPSSRCLFIGCSDAGPYSALELWRHSSTTDCYLADK